MHITRYAAPGLGLHIVKQNVELPAPAAHEVLIEISHCSVGRGDVGFLKNAFRIPDLAYPLVAGHELVGHIIASGEAVRDLTVNDRVGAGYQVWSCGTCTYCTEHREQLCQRQRCLVQHTPGGFASHIAVDERFVFKLPDILDSAAATPLFCSGLTVFSVIKKAHIAPGMKVGVIGIGGLGHIAVQLLHHLDAHVTAFSGNATKAPAIKTLGADEVMTYESEAVATQAYDLLFVTTPAPIKYDYYLQRLKPDGELWIIGSATRPTTFSSWLLNDFADRSIRGSYIGSPDEMRELLVLAAKHGISGAVKTMPMAQLEAVLKAVDARAPDFRIVVTNI